MTLHNAGITAVAKELPEKILSNADLEKMVETSDEWITTRTGIKERRIYDGPTSDLAAGALRKALEQRGMDPLDLELIIVATATPDHFFPSTACLAQDKVGARNAWGFDLSAACSGFLFALQVAAQIVRTGAQRNVAVIGADVMSSIVDYTSRETCILFGDGAAATIVEPVEGRGLYDFMLGSDGSRGDLLIVPASGSKMPPTSEALQSRKQFVHMEGREVFKHAVNGMNETCAAILRRNNLTVADIDLLVAHQANARILEAIRTRLGLPPEKVVLNLDRYGNTTGASIPLCLAEIHEEGRVKPGDTILLTAFGGGFTWGSGLMEWSIG